MEKQIKKYKVLVVDNAPDMLNNIVKIFENCSGLYRTLFALNGEDALEVAINHLPDIIISDWDIPELSGIELIRELKKNDATKNIPVILVTGIMTSVDDLKMAFDTGANDYIRKPFDEIELFARLRSLLTLCELNKETKLHKSALEESEQRFRMLANATFEGIVIHDKINIIDVNQRLLSMTGFEREDIVGSSIFEIISPEFYNTIISNIETDDEKCCNIKCKRKDNSAFDVEIWSKPINYKATNSRVAAIRDITAQMEHQAQLNIQREENLMLERKVALNLKNELETKKRELIANAMLLLQATEKNNKMITELETLFEDVDNDKQKQLKLFVSKYKNNFIDESLKEFNLRFVETNKDFYSKLKQRFSGLTVTERKLCALLNLDLTSKEIAVLTFQSQDSIYVARSRLRKKLNLDKGEDFATFFESL